VRGEPLAGFSLAMGEEGEASALPLEGERIKVGQEKWLKVFPKKFEVLEFVVNLKLSGEEGEDGVLCAMVVTDISLMKDGGMLVYGRAIGSTDEEFLKTLHLEMNRRKRAIHLCREKVCTAALDEVVAHSGEVALWKAQNFKGDYLKPWGSQVLKEILEKELGIGSGLSGPEPKRRSGRALKRPAASTEKPEPAPKRVRRRRDTSGKGIGGQGPGEAHGSSLLAQQLAGLKRSLLSKVKETVINVEDNEEDTPAGGGDGDMDLGFVGGERPWDSMVKQERRSSSGDHLNPKRSMLALTSGLPVEASRGGFTRRSRRRSPERTEVSKHPAQQLLAVAAEQGRSRRDQRRQRKRRGSEDGRKEKDGEDRSSRKRRRKDKKKKKEKKMKKEKGRKKRKPGGDSGGSSSSDSGSSRESDSGSSTSSSLLAPLQRKSREEPGAVLRMLVKHARETLDQSALVDTEESRDITKGVKLSSYFSLMLRPYYSTASRDMKELFHLANCVDQLRSGQLGLLGDSLASRFLAIHCAMVEGTWKSAQYLELNPLDAPNSAPTPVLLEAKRHAKLIYKSQNHDGQRRWNEWEWKGEENPKGGKGRPGNGRGDWGNWQRGSWWDANRDKKDGKDGKDTGGEGKEKK